MKENEAAARALAERLGAAGIDAHVGGAGVHWHVNVGPVASRALVVHCFWYERALSGLLLGLNPANSRSRLGPERRPPYEGPEHLVILRDGEARVADGRTRAAADVVACARAWLAGVELDRLVGEVPFVDEKPRRLRTLAAGLAPQLRWDIGEEPGCELWVYGDGRSCKVVVSNGERFDCSFLLGQAQVARGSLEDVSAGVAAWLVARVPVRALAASADGVELESHAEVLETDPARWHWLHLLQRIADPDDVLAPQRDLVEALAASPVATSFYSYSSLSWLCFSASSHYPWVDEGLPHVVRASDADYMVGTGHQKSPTPCDLHRAVNLIERELAASQLRPFFGSAPHHELPLLSACLMRQGSALRPQLVQRGAWYELVVEDPARKRRCKVSGESVSFDLAGRSHASWPTLDEACRAIILYCEGGASPEDVLRSAPPART